MNISPSNYNLYEPVSLTNEIPHLSVFNILNRQLQTEWSKDIIGQVEIDYLNYDTVKLIGRNLSDISKNPYDEAKNPELYQAYMNEIVGHQSISYRPIRKNVIFVNDSVGNIEEIIQDKINFSVTGLFETEIDYLMHEAHRYLFKLYPEHINTLKTLTPTESLLYLQEAGYILHNNFDLSNVKGVDSETDLYLRHKFITNLYSVLGFTGSNNQESLLVNLLGGEVEAKTLSVYLGDNKYGILSNKYDLSKLGNTYQGYQFFSETEVLKDESSQTYANTQNDFSFTLDSKLQTELALYVLSTLKVWNLQPNLQSFLIQIKELVNNLYRYNDINPSENEPIPTSLGLRDLILEFKKLKVVDVEESFNSLRFLESFRDNSSLVPIKGELSEISMDDFRTVSNCWFTSLYSFADVLNSEAILLGNITYNKSFLEYISLIVYEQLIQAFSDKNFKLTYNTYISSLDEIPWSIRFEVSQKNSENGYNQILSGILNNSVVEKAYMGYKPFNIGDGSIYEPFDLTPQVIFKAIIEPEDIESAVFTGGDLNITFSISSLQDPLDLEDFPTKESDYGIVILEKKEHEKVFDLNWRLQYYNTWNEYQQTTELQNYSLDKFILRFNTVELPYVQRISINELFFKLYTLTKDYLLDKLVFYNKLIDSDLSYQDALLVSGLKLTPNNVVEVLSNGQGINDYLLHKIDGILEDTTSIKLDEDISELVSTYGRLNCLIVDNLGNNYYAKINKCNIQNTYCVANISQVYPEIDLQNFDDSKIRLYLLNSLDKVETVNKVQEVVKENSSNIKLSEIPFGYGYILESTLDPTLTNSAYDNLLSEDLLVYDHQDLIDSEIPFPSSLVKDCDLTTLSNVKASSMNLYESFIQDNKSLYVDNQLVLLLEAPYLKSNVIYLNNQELLSLNIQTELLPNKAIFAHINENNYPKLKKVLDDLLNQGLQDLSNVPTLINKNLVIWGDLFWDTQLRYSERTSRSIWSDYLADYKIFNVGASFPKWEDLLISTPSDDLHISSLCRFNYAYNDGSPHLNYKLALPGPAMSHTSNKVDLIKLYENFNTMPGPALTKKLKGNEDPIVGLVNFKSKIDKLVGNSYDIVDFEFKNCPIYRSSNYNQNSGSSLVKSIIHNKLDLNLKVKDSDEIYSLYPINRYLPNKSTIEIPTLFDVGSPSFELLAQSLVIDYVRDVKNCDFSASNIEIYFYDVLDHLINKIQTNKQVPAVLQIDSNKVYVCSIYAIKKIDNSIEYNTFQFELEKMPELVSNFLGLTNLENLQVTDTVSLENLKTNLITKAAMTPINIVGSVDQVEMDSDNPIITSYDENGNLQNTNYKLIQSASDMVLEEEGFSINDVFKDKSNTTKYVVKSATPKFKEFSTPLINLSLDELKDGEKYPNVLFKFPEDWKLSEDRNILIGEMATPITRTAYTSDKEIYLLDRNYQLDECNIVASDDEYVYLKDGRYSNNVSQVIRDLKSDNPKPIEIKNTTVEICRHWPNPNSNIDYTYFKRKFIAKGFINKNTPDRVLFDDLGEVLLSDHISPTDKVALILLNSATSSMESTRYQLPNSIPGITDTTQYTWKLLGGFLDRDISNELGYTIYLFAKSENEGRAYKLMLNQNPTISLCGSSEDFTQIIDAYLDDSFGLHYLTKDLEIINIDGSEPDFLNEDYIIPDSLTVSNTNVALLNLGSEDEFSETVYREIGKNLKIYEDGYGRLSIRKDGKQILLNDISTDNYYDYAKPDQFGPSLETLFSYLELIIPVDENGKILDVNDSSISNLDKTKLNTFLKNPATSVGKTIQQVFESNGINKILCNSLTTGMNTGVESLEGVREIIALTVDSNSRASSSDLKGVYDAINSTQVNNFGQKNLDNFIDTDPDPNKGDLIFIDKDRCIIYDLIKSTNRLKITPLADYLTYTVDDLTGNTKTGNTCLALNLVLPNEFETWKGIIEDCLEDPTFETELNEAYGLETEFTLDNFNNWLNEVSSLIYSNPAKAYNIYNAGFSLDRLIDYFKYNSLGKDFESVLSPLISLTQLESLLGENLLNPRDVYIEKCLELGFNCDNWGSGNEPLAPMVVTEPGPDTSESELMAYNNYLNEKADYEAKMEIVNSLRPSVEEYNKQAYYRLAFARKKSSEYDPDDTYIGDTSMPQVIRDVWNILKDLYDTTTDPVMKLMCFAAIAYDYKEYLFNIDEDDPISNYIMSGLELPGSLNNLVWDDLTLVPIRHMTGFKSAVNTINLAMDENIIYVSGTINTTGKPELISIWGEGDNIQFCLKMDTSTDKIEKEPQPAEDSIKGIHSLTFLPNKENVILETINDKAVLINKEDLGYISRESPNNDIILSQLPLKPLFDSNYFSGFDYINNDLYITSSYNINNEPEVFTTSVKNISSDYITLLDNLNFDNGDQLEVVAFIEDLTKDNFKLGFNSVGSVLETIPEDFTMFKVSSKSYADFAMRCNSLRINPITSRYEPIFENKTYPRLSDIKTGAKISDFYATDDQSNLKVLANRFGRIILPILPTYMEVGDKQITASFNLSNIIKRGFVEFCKEDYETDNIQDEYDVTLPYSYIIGKDYETLEPLCDKLYQLVDDPISAILNHPIEVETLDINENSILEVYDNYIRIPLSSFEEKSEYESSDARLDNENSFQNLPTLKEYVTLKSLSVCTNRSTDKLPRKVKISDIQWGLNQNVVYTDASEIVFPMQGYGCSDLDAGDYFNPNSCRFDKGTFFKSGELKNRKGETLKVLLGQDTLGNNLYDEDFFKENTLVYKSFKEADSLLPKNLRPKDISLSEKDFLKNQLIQIDIDKESLIKENVLSLNLSTCVGILGQNYMDLYSNASLNKIWSVKTFRKSEKVDENKGFEDLRNVEVKVVNLKSGDKLEDIIGYTRRSSSELLRIIPANTQFLQEDGFSKNQTPFFLNNGVKEYALGESPDSLSIYACDTSGNLIKVLEGGELRLGGTEGKLVPASIQDVKSLNMFDFVLTPNAISSKSGLYPLIPVSDINLKTNNDYIHFQPGNLKYIYLQKEDDVISAELEVYNTSINTDNFEICRFNAKVSNLEFSYSSDSLKEYNYVTFLTKNNRVSGAIYLKEPVSSQTAISYLPLTV